MPKQGRYQRLNRGDLATGGQFTRLAKPGNVYMGPPVVLPKKEEAIATNLMEVTKHEEEVKALNMRIGALRKELQQTKMSQAATPPVIRENKDVENKLKQSVAALAEELQQSKEKHSKDTSWFEKQTAQLRERITEMEEAAAEPKKKGGPSKALLEARAMLKEKEEESAQLKEMLAQLAQENEDLTRELEESKLQTQEPVLGMRILKVKEVLAQDGLVRMDCVMKPTTGPLGDVASIIMAEEDVEKILDATFGEESDD